MLLLCTTTLMLCLGLLWMMVRRFSIFLWLLGFGCHFAIMVIFSGFLGCISLVSGVLANLLINVLWFTHRIINRLLIHYLRIILLSFILFLFLALVFLFPLLFFFFILFFLCLEFGPLFVEIGINPLVFLAAQLPVLYDIDPRNLKVTCVQFYVEVLDILIERRF